MDRGDGMALTWVMGDGMALTWVFGYSFSEGGCTFRKVPKFRCKPMRELVSPA